MGVSINQNGWPAGLTWNNRTKTLHLNGYLGHVQVFHPVTKDTLNLDIARQNSLWNELRRNTHNSDVEAMALSQDGLCMVTVDCCKIYIQHSFMNCEPLSLNANIIKKKTDYIK